MGPARWEVLRGLDEVRRRKRLVPCLARGQSLIDGSPLDEEDPTPEGPGQGMLYPPVYGASQQSAHHLVGLSRIPGPRDALCDFRVQVSFKALPGLILGFVSDPNAQMERGIPQTGRRGSAQRKFPTPPLPRLSPIIRWGPSPETLGWPRAAPGPLGCGLGVAVGLSARELCPRERSSPSPSLPPSLQTADNRERVGGAEHPAAPALHSGDPPRPGHTPVPATRTPRAGGGRRPPRLPGGIGAGGPGARAAGGLPAGAWAALAEPGRGAAAAS